MPHSVVGRVMDRFTRSLKKYGKGVFNLPDVFTDIPPLTDTMSVDEASGLELAAQGDSHASVHPVRSRRSSALRRVRRPARSGSPRSQARLPVGNKAVGGTSAESKRP